MKAICLESPYQILIKEIPQPIKKEGEALIRVLSAGICGSDIGAYKGTNLLVTYPRIIGHEVVGEIIEVDKNEYGYKVGDRVIIDPYKYCGQCYPCSIKRTNCCESLQVLGVHVDGGMAEYISHPLNLLIPVSKSIPIEIVPLAEPLTIALHAIHRTKVNPGEKVAIIGAGPIGILVALCSIFYNASPILIDYITERLEFAKSIGIKNTIQINHCDVIQEIKKMTNNRLAEVVIEASGSNSAIKNTLDYVSFAGRIAFTGWPSKMTELPTNLITFKELDLYGSRTSAGEFPEAIELIRTHSDKLQPLLSKVISFEDVPIVIKEISDHPEKFLKVNILF